MVSAEKYLKKILDEIEIKKAQGKSGIYKINEVIEDETADALRKYFEGSQSYRVEIKRCANCKHTYDVLIFFL